MITCNVHTFNYVLSFEFDLVKKTNLQITLLISVKMSGCLAYAFRSLPRNLAMGVVRGVSRPRKLVHKPRPLRKTIAMGVAYPKSGAESPQPGGCGVCPPSRTKKFPVFIYFNVGRNLHEWAHMRFS